MNDFKNLLKNVIKEQNQLNEVNILRSLAKFSNFITKRDHISADIKREDGVSDADIEKQIKSILDKVAAKRGVLKPVVIVKGNRVHINFKDKFFAGFEIEAALKDSSLAPKGPRGGKRSLNIKRGMDESDIEMILDEGKVLGNTSNARGWDAKEILNYSRIKWDTEETVSGTTIFKKGRNTVAVWNNMTGVVVAA